MKLHLFIAAGLLALLPSAAPALTVTQFNLVTSGTGTNGAWSVAGTVSPVNSSPCTGGGWVLGGFQLDVLTGPLVMPEMPALAVPATNVPALAGQNQVLIAPVIGTPPVHYQWRCGNLTLTGQTNSTLALTGITTNTAGNYFVVLTSPFGSVTSLVASVTVSGVFPQQAYSPTLNPLTGLYEELVVVTNLTGAISGVQLLAGGLPARVSLYNVAGTNNGLPYAQFNGIMTNGAIQTFLLQFLNPYRLNFTNTVQALAVAAVPGAANAIPGIALTQCYRDMSLPDSPRFTFAFCSVAGRSYQVVYSDDLQAWRVAATLTASANWTIWTELSPAPNSRFFKVIALP